MREALQTLVDRGACWTVAGVAMMVGRSVVVLISHGGVSHCTIW